MKLNESNSLIQINFEKRKQNIGVLLLLLIQENLTHFLKYVYIKVP